MSKVVYMYVCPCSPHQFRYLHGAYAVNEHFQRTDGVQVHSASEDHVVLNHYLLKSWQVGATVERNQSLFIAGNLPKLA